MHKDIQKICFSATEIQKRVAEIAKELDELYKGEEVVFLGILKGSLPFYIDLARHVNFPVTFDLMAVSSYGCSTESSGMLNIKMDMSEDIKDKHVLIIEDILDTGNTLFKLHKRLLSKNPKSLRICCLLDKPARRIQNIQPDITGFSVPDAFLVGYGLDYAEHYRNLPYIGILKQELYENH